MDGGWRFLSRALISSRFLELPSTANHFLLCSLDPLRPICFLLIAFDFFTYSFHVLDFSSTSLHFPLFQTLSSHPPTYVHFWIW